MTKYLRVILGLFFILSNLDTFATHKRGAEFEYRCKPNGTYEVTLYFYYDCTATIAPPSSVNGNITYQANCSNPPALPTKNFQLINPGGTEISQLCPSVESNCGTGSIPGVELYIFRDTSVVLPPCQWNINFTLCCRSVGVDNLINSGGQPFMLIQE